VDELLLKIQAQDLRKIVIYNQVKNTPAGKKALRRGEESLTLPSSPLKTRVQSPTKRA
jgi:hypothetical protein